ncbi:aminotransferase class I/II-fold pyridoxal phosphate-dependent enzyme [Actinomadura coerulea]|uniref:aminotransferase class I/II-fold pyridoxal phosphate-dependent enzyme n=1 Tax=Actinomadura coerulea TaxID=46159 RepID=UPI0034483AC3
MYPTTQADCLTAFGTLRRGAPADAFEIGEGCNRFPPSPVLGRYLADLLHRLVRRGAMSGYTDPFNGGARTAVAELLGPHLEIPLAPSDIFFTRGGTEAINLTIAHLAATGHGLILPLPNYYAFDQSAVRWGAPITGYYRHDGAIHHTGADLPQRTCLVEVLPNGITGAPHTIPARSAPNFTLLDVPFQTCLHNRSSTGILRERIRRLDLRRSAIIITASKDLSLPGLRAAAVISKSTALMEHLGRDNFERIATTSNPLAEMAITLYSSVLPMLEAPHQQSAQQTVRSAHAIVKRAGLPELPGHGDFQRLRQHLTAMSDRFRRNTETLDSEDSPVRIVHTAAPAAGYSAFAELREPQPDFLRWVQECGRQGLRLNPAVVHGGTIPAWEALHPGQQFLRMNLSEPPTELKRGLNLIKEHARFSRARNEGRAVV